MYSNSKIWIDLCVVGSLDTVPEELDKDSNSVSTQGKEMRKCCLFMYEQNI